MDSMHLFLSKKYLPTLKARRYSTLSQVFNLHISTVHSELIFCVLYEVGLSFVFSTLTHHSFKKYFFTPEIWDVIFVTY